jgi:hypothetical protein
MSSGQREDAGYTANTLRFYVRPVAMCVVLAMTALPAVTLTCLWACGAADERAGSSHAHHEGGEAAHSSAAVTDTAAVRATHPDCDHATVLDPGVRTEAFRLIVLSALTVAEPPLTAPSPRGRVCGACFTSPSPPGTPQSAPIPLRI